MLGPRPYNHWYHRPRNLRSSKFTWLFFYSFVVGLRALLRLLRIDYDNLWQAYMIQSLRAESINRALGFSSMRDFVQIACCGAHSTDWDTQTWHALYRMEYAPFGGWINITSVAWTSNESEYFKREDGRPAVTLDQGMRCNLWLHSQLCPPLLSSQSLLEYTLTARWSMCQGQPDVFWTYSSASLITEGQRSAPGGVLRRKNISALLRFVSGHPFSDKCLFSSRLTCCNGFVTLAAYTKSKVCQQSCVWFHKTLWWCHGIAIVSDGNGIMFFVYCGTEGLRYAFTRY